MRPQIPSDLTSRTFDESLFTAFQLATLRGPLCAEPMTGMAFIVERLEVSSTPEDQEEGTPTYCACHGRKLHTYTAFYLVRSRFSQLAGTLISNTQDAFQAGLLDWSPRLLLAMYSCDIQTSGKLRSSLRCNS